MKLYKVKVYGIDEVKFTNKENNSITIMYQYYFSTKEASEIGFVFNSAYSRKLIHDEYIPVVIIDGKYKIIEE